MKKENKKPTILKTAGGLEYEAQYCQNPNCKKLIEKREVQSRNRYENQKYCGQKCAKSIMKKKKQGWFGSRIMISAEQRKQMREVDEMCEEYGI